MKAAIRRQYGDADTLKIEEVATPFPKETEILVKVFASTINRTDCAILTGKPYIMRLFSGLTTPRFPSTGTDFAGVVEAVGSKVTKFTVGDRVWGFNDTGIGSHAQYMVFPANGNVIHIPENITFEQAAASAEGAHYAYNFIKKVPLKAGDRVMVYGATGAIGSALVQQLKHFGAYVMGVCSTPHIKVVKSLGVDEVIDYSAQDFTKTTEKYNYVFDAVGKSTFAICKPLLIPDGVYISSELGPRWQNTYLPLITAIKGGKKVVFPIPTNVMDSLHFMAKLLKKGEFVPLIDKEIPLEEIAEAYKYVNSGQKIGNVILKPWM